MEARVEYISVHVEGSSLLPDNSLCCGEPMAVVDQEFELKDPESGVTIRNTEPVPGYLCPCGLDYGAGEVYDLLYRASVVKLDKLGIHSKVRSALGSSIRATEALNKNRAQQV